MDNKGMGHITVLIVIICIIGLIIGTVYYTKTKINKVHIETLKTNMLLIEWKVKHLQEKNVAEGKEIVYIGTKLSEFYDKIMKEKLISENVITLEEMEKYYVLEDKDMAELTLEITNEENAYYIINYETEDIIYSKGCSYEDGKTMYKLNEIENAKK